jgi:plastocyanin
MKYIPALFLLFLLGCETPKIEHITPHGVTEDVKTTVCPGQRVAYLHNDKLFHVVTTVDAENSVAKHSLAECEHD